MPAPEGPQRGNLKVYLGYAAGVGKTFQMLADGHAAVERGVDVAVAYFEPHARHDTIAQVQGLDHVPHRKLDYRGRTFEEMNTDAVLARGPRVALVDELAHTNIPGSTRAKRWEDVQTLLDAGIEVWTTMNVQHIESLNDHVWQVTGIRVRETVPDWVIRQAAEIVAVDVTPEALLNRLKRGAIYKPEMVEKALTGFFKGSNLGALREMTLRQAAHEVDLRQSVYDEASDLQVPTISKSSSAETSGEQLKERILIHITADASSAMLLRRGRRVADFLHSTPVALFVHKTPEFADLPAAEREAIEKHLRFARNLRIETAILGGQDVSRTVVDFARRNQVSQIFVARSPSGLRERLLGGRYAEDIVRMADDLQVIVVANRSRRHNS
jgi:two-component system, OmpR family, sensor histidine kinase KdpD